MASNLETGIQLARVGDYQKAIPYLATALKQDPSVEEGWYWLGVCVDDIERKKYCFKRVLMSNPRHVQAGERLACIMEPLAAGDANLSHSISGPEEKDTRVVTEGGQPEAVTPPAKDKKYNWRIVSLLAGLFLCGLPLLGLAMVLRASSPIVTVHPQQELGSDPEMSQKYMFEGRSQTLQGKYTEAIPYLDKAIAYDSSSDEPYYWRSICYYNLTAKQRMLSEYMDYADQAMADVNQAIALRPDNGDYYVLRSWILTAISEVQDYQVDRVHAQNLALEDMHTGLEFGTSIGSYPEGYYISDLIYTGHCEEALDEIEMRIRQLPPEISRLSTLYTYKALVYNCLGQPDQAVVWIDKSMFNDYNIPYKSKIKAIYLYQAGRSEESLALLDQLIETAPSYSGERYYLRALIRYENGEVDAAEEDLAIGMGNTWGRAGTLSYVQGKMELDGGDLEGGIALLQDAEASLSMEYNVLRLRIRQELSDLGAEPLDKKPTISVAATPIPAFKMLQPTPSSGYQNGNLVDFPASEVPFPYARYVTVPKDEGHTGYVRLLSTDYPLFQFRPSGFIDVEKINSLVINLLMLDEQIPNLEFYLWSPQNKGEWIPMQFKGGENPVMSPERYVMPNGDVYLAIRPLGENQIEISDLWLMLVVEFVNGDVKALHYP